MPTAVLFPKAADTVANGRVVTSPNTSGIEVLALWHNVCAAVCHLFVSELSVLSGVL